MRKKTNQAFTLIEAIVALAIVATALVALIRLHLISIRLHDQTQQTQRATFLASEKLEQTLASGFPEIGLQSGIETENEYELHWQVKINNAILPHSELASLKNLRQVEVTTHWQQGKNAHRVHLISLIARRTLP